MVPIIQKNIAVKEIVAILPPSLSISYSSLSTHGRQTCWYSGIPCLKGAAFSHFRIIALAGVGGVGTTVNINPSDGPLEGFLFSL